MTDTAQPLAAETDAFEDAATAFKVSLGQEDPQALPERDEQGRFRTSTPDAEQEPDPAPEMAEDDVEAGEVEQPEPETEEVEEEAQQDATPMPTSWSREDEELWSTLPAEAQAKIADREAQRDRAVNQKFEEVANVRKAHEAAAEEAQRGRAEYIQAVDQVIGLIVPPEPPLSMLDHNSVDYNPDEYHILDAQRARAIRAAETLHAQRQTAVAQFAQVYEEQQKQRGQEMFQTLNAVARDAFIKDVPDLLDQAKGMDVLNGLADYAMKQGVPAAVFQDNDTSAFEWHVLWKAREYDRLQAAKAKVKATPAPEPKKATPAVRPGVATPRSTIERQQRTKDYDRLRKSGSIADGAAVFKHFL